MTVRDRKIILVSSAAVACFLLVFVLFLVKYANIIAKSGIEKALGRDFSIERIELKWGSVRAQNIVMKDKAGKEIVKVEGLVVKADFMGLLRQKYIFSSVLIERPYMYVEVDKKGGLASPVFPSMGTTADKQKKGTDRVVTPPAVFKKIVVVNGSVDYLDRKSPEVPVMTRVRDINMEIRDLSMPFTNDSTRYTLRASVPASGGTASVKSEGTIKLASRDMESATQVRGLDITHFKHYYRRRGSVDIKKGLIDIDVRARVVSRSIHAPGRAVIRGLEFASGSGMGDRFMGVPINLVAAFLKKSGDQLPVDFVIAGDLDNPKFNITEDFVSRLSFGIAEKLGLSVKDIGESVFGVGAEGTKKVGEGIQGIGEGIKNLFKK